jgi:hypothetical protein
VPGRQSLIQISGSAYAVLDKRAVTPLFYMAHMQTIPPQSLTVGALGNLDTNGNLYVVLPDGDPDVTVIADGKGYYIFSVSAVKYHLAIAAITNGTAQYLEYAAPTFCVGQQITFVPQWITYPYTYPSAPPYSHATADWTLPGTFVNEQPFPATCDEYYDDNTNLLHQDSATNSALSTSCWYVTGMQGGNASVAMKLAFSNKQIAINAAGTFNVYRPKTVFNPTYIGTPQVVANSALTLYPPMSFAHDVQSDFPGVAGYTQLVGGEYTDSATGNILDVGGVTPQTELDLGELYYGTQPITSTNGSLAFSDAPLVGFSPTTFMTSQNITLNAYLLFKPDGSGSIFVPLRLVTWNLNDSAQYVSGAWSVETGNPVAAPADNDTSAFPLWTNTFSTF